MYKRKDHRANINYIVIPTVATQNEDVRWIRLLNYQVNHNHLFGYLDSGISLQNELRLHLLSMRLRT